MAKVTLNNIYKIYPGDKGKDVTAVRDFNIEITDRDLLDPRFKTLAGLTRIILEKTR